MEQAYEIEKLNNEANINEEDTKIGEDKINKDNIWILYIVVGIIIVILIIFCYLKHKKWKNKLLFYKIYRTITNYVIRMKKWSM